MEKSRPPEISSTPPALSKRWILMVDDEPAMQRLVETILNDQGWTVRLANGGVAALAALEGGGGPPSLLICDVLMPGLDGLELTRRLLAKVPDLKVILISGHLADVSWWPTDLREHRFLTKPFTRDQLIAVVSDLLSDRDTTG
jgi:two-component system, cell cycle sensor histidine kinase and response regulator CckA